MKRTLLSWSSGKDSAWSFHILRQQNEYEIVGLLTTFNRAANRVAMHGVRRSLVEAQAKAAGVPLWDIVNLSHDPLGQLTQQQHRLCSRTRPIIEEVILRRLEMPGH